jgi:hypothetical protein
MCAQVAEAARQTTRAARELLCANVLDASLRTLYGKPYQVRGGKRTTIETCMQGFRKRYLRGSEWDQPCKRVLRTYHDLRDRNAHPDWLTRTGAAEFRLNPEQSIDHTVRLALFYGYMILALAGFDDLKPEFPAAHKDWPPTLTMTSPQ